MKRHDTVHHTASYIASVQQASGAIPWFVGGKLDPWDHVEAAMGLTIAGYYDEAEAAYAWLAKHQRPDGTWLAAYRDELVIDATRAETNFVAYIATGVWHHFLVTRNRQFLERLWPTVKAALDFVAGMQAPTGEVYWALDTRTGINKDALITGCSSIFKSLECGINMAVELGEAPGSWATQRDRLGHAIRNQPDRFDRTWESKDRYSMDWFYPVLSGVFTGAAARQRLAERWHHFVEPSWGCRCVSDQPWVTIAETCELVLACLAADRPERGRKLFEQLARYQLEDGSWWTGYVFPDDAMWPDERPTWTSGAVLLAADAMLQLTPAARLFTSVELVEPPQHAQRQRLVERLKQP